MTGIYDAYGSVLAALCLWREARGCTREAKAAVAEVLRNRMLDPRWPDDLAELVLQPRQFSSFNSSDPNASKFPRPDDVAWKECCAVIEEIMSLPRDDKTKGANHYHSLPDGSEPSWADAERQTARIGPFRFYRL